MFSKILMANRGEIAMLGKAVQTLDSGEGDRRGAPACADSLIAFAGRTAA